MPTATIGLTAITDLTPIMADRMAIMVVHMPMATAIGLTGITAVLESASALPSKAPTRL